MLVDLMVALTICLYALFGVKRGFEKMFLEFFVFILAMVIAIVYYKISSNPLITLGVFLGLSVIVSAVLRAYFRTKDEASGGELKVSSKFGGAILGIIWAFIFMIAFFMMVKVVPPSLPYAQEVSNMVNESYIYKSFSKPFLDKFFSITKIEYLAKIIEDKDTLVKVKSSPEFQAILTDEKIKAIAEDEVLLQYIKEKNYSKLVTNPKVVALLQDGKVLESFIGLDFKTIIERDE